MLGGSGQFFEKNGGTLAINRRNILFLFYRRERERTRRVAENETTENPAFPRRFLGALGVSAVPP